MEQLQKEKATASAEKRAKALEAQCEQLKQQLHAAKKRPRGTKASNAPSDPAPEDQNPKKRPSPDPKPVGHLVDIMAGAGDDNDMTSDDAVEIPCADDCPEPQSKKSTTCQKFRGLKSIVCAYKMKEIK